MARASQPPVAARTYYRPIEASIRWCGLLRFEKRILSALAGRPLPDEGEFRRWPTLRLNAERILDALAHDELPRRIAGRAAAPQTIALDDPALVVRHVDLRVWMARYYPGEKPAFLFDEIERALHPALTQESLGFLLAEREAIRARLDNLLLAHDALHSEYADLTQAHASCRARVENDRTPGPRAESTYLNIIGGLLSLLLGKSPGGAPYSSFRNMESVISALLAHHENLPGISERTLWSKLAQARRQLQGMG